MKKLLKAALILTSAAMIAVPLASCGEKPVDPPTPPVVVVDVTSLEVSSAQINLQPGETKTLEVTVLPENATNKALKFTSTDTDTVTVSAEGVVEAKKDGTAAIIISSVANPSISKQVIVNVKTAHVSVTEISVNKATLDLKEGESEDLVVTVLPENATNKALTFSSTNSSVATVSKEGKVAAVSSGTAVINIFSVDNPAAFKQVTVNVKRDHIDVSSVEVSENEMSVKVGDSFTIPVTVSPEDATDKSLTWESSAPSIISVDETGKITAQAAGSATITVKSVDNPAAYAIITITAKENVTSVDGVTLDKETLSIAENGEAQLLVATVSPAEADNKAVRWESSNPQVASVSANGLVTPIKAGTTTITVTTIDGEFTDECEVTITKVELESIALDLEKIDFSVAATGSDKQKQLNLTLNPTNPTYTEVTWMSTNEDVATVTSTGLVEMVGEGTCAIVVTHVNSGKTASCAVSVNKVEATRISLDTTEIYFTLNSGDASKQLNVSFEPENVTHKEITWISSDSSVATVSNTGLVTKVGKGEATITARHNDSGLTATCDVYVTEDSVFTVRGCDVAENWSKYTINKGARENPLAEFVTKDISYKVGDDNAISFKPILHVFKGRQEVDPSNYTGGFTVKVEKKVNASYIDAPAAEFAALESDASIDFTESAIGNTYKLTICPKQIDESFIEDFTHVYLVDVIDGYNVTKVEELSLFDTTDNSYVYDGGGDVSGLHSDWVAYKSAHNIPLNLHPTTMILHNDLLLTEAALPSNFFYTAEEAKSWSDTEQKKSIGSLKDYAYLYIKTTEGNLNFVGNYFAVDWSKLPLVTRANGAEQTPSNKLNCHSSTFRLINGSLNLENISFIGNSHVAKTDDDIKFDGGLIAFKFAWRTDFATFNNVLEHGCYIGVMSEGSDGVKAPAVVTVKDAKFYDNNNSFLYNWGGDLTLKNSLFEGCGGPVVIQDHTGVDTSGDSPVFDYIDEANGRFEIVGYDPHTTFEDCTINNYVIGTESWFKSFGADALAPQIKVMSDTLSAVSPSAGRTFLFGADHKGVLAQAAQGETVFNFIVLNKSGSAEGVTAYMVDGDVKFINNGVETDHFNYLRPNNVAAPTQEEIDRFTAECTFNQYFRGVNGNNPSAPVFETKGGTYTIANQQPLVLSTVDSLALNAATGGVVPLADPDPNVCTNAANYIALYYMGMMMVFELGTIGQ